MDKDLRELIDRDKIRRIIVRNARGLDRLDSELVNSTYHDDAWDYHGTTDAPAREFTKKAMESLSNEQIASHLLGQTDIEVDGDVAYAETYFFVQSIRDEKATRLPLAGPGPHLMFSSGRYIDRFEKRSGEWLIAQRKVLIDYLHASQLNQGGMSMDIFHRPKRSKDDDSYIGRNQDF